jgi:hypothetical protein
MLSGRRQIHTWIQKFDALSAVGPPVVSGSAIANGLFLVSEIINRLRSWFANLGWLSTRARKPFLCCDGKAAASGDRPPTGSPALLAHRFRYQAAISPSPP